MRDTGWFWPSAGAIAAIAGSSPLAAQTLGQAPDEGVSAFRVIAVLGLCLLLAAAGALAIRFRLNGNIVPQGLGQGSRRLVLVERLRLSPQVAVCLVRCDDREYLVALSAGAVHSFREITPEMGEGNAGKDSVP